MVLVDTSVWVHGLRERGDEEWRRTLHGLLTDGEVAWCAMVRLELWSGARGAREKKSLKDMEDMIPELDIDDAVWEEAMELGRLARGKGITAPAADVLIAACAGYHGVRLVHADKHLAALMEL